MILVSRKQLMFIYTALITGSGGIIITIKVLHLRVWRAKAQLLVLKFYLIFRKMVEMVLGNLGNFLILINLILQ